MPEDQWLIKKSSIEEAAPGLFHVVVEITSAGHDSYILVPMTDRVMPLSIVADDDRYTDLEALADAITELPSNSTVYAARVDAFHAGDSHIRILTSAELEQLRELLIR